MPLLWIFIWVLAVLLLLKSGLDAVVKDMVETPGTRNRQSLFGAKPKSRKTKESSYLIHIAQKVADLHQVSVDRLAQITTDNSIKLFGF